MHHWGACIQSWSWVKGVKFAQDQLCNATNDEIKRQRGRLKIGGLPAPGLWLLLAVPLTTDQPDS